MPTENPLETTVTVESNDTHTQFCATYGGREPVYLLLKRAVELEIVETIAEPLVMQTIAYAYLKDENEIQTHHVTPLWKGYGLALALSAEAHFYLYNMGIPSPYHSIEAELMLERQERDLKRGMALLEAALYIGDTFAGISYSPLL